ncbi:MAG: hypothetical protein XXXNARYT_002802 [Candidatus Accumulibacter regalis]|jgi:hypothetical protein|nr:hypothetical protein [Candidatus Accumulibacter phosphatis]HRE87381.1 hypothetical protein [Accumulibacter sp.]
MVERFFREITGERLRRGVFTSVLASPNPRHHVDTAVALYFRRDFQHAGQPLATLSALEFLAPILRATRHGLRVG